MKWPNHTDYQDALQDPRTCFAEPDLQAGQTACDVLGLPRVMSGNFASVYEIATPDGNRWAIRCFVRQVTGTQARYARLSEHLESVKVPWIVGFDFILKGVLVQGDWYPIVKMQWVEGSAINSYIEEHLNESETLLSLASQFRLLMKDLRQHRIAHGDLQHGNIMVTPGGELRLVDYDGMYCPAFGKKRSPELGHANFQHPLRLADYYDESLDNFSALVIYTSLLAIAAEPELWREFNTGDNLILSSADFRNTQGSKVFARLKAITNPEVQQLATLLQQCCVSPIAFVPWFEETIIALKNGTLQSSIELLPGEASPADSPAQGDGWWENSQARTAIGTRRSPTGTRPGSAAEALAGGTPQVTTATATRGASSAQTGPSGGSRPAPMPGGSRPAPVAAPEPTYSGIGSSEPEETGVSLQVKLAVAALVVLFLIGIIVSIARKNTSASSPPPASTESQ
jgi:hypothetical protein